jgi:GNAT superfamily N-acetyltransferase
MQQQKPHRLRLTRPSASYELQVDAASRGAGLGKVLMQHFEALALHAGMRKTMLTVFTSNEGARRFYRHIGCVAARPSPQLQLC